MKIHRDFTSLGEVKNAIVSIGNFDGVHKGHQQIIQQVINRAQECGGESVIITFNPHPRIVLGNDEDFRLISSYLDKVDRFQHTGIDHLVVINFNKEFAALSSEQFAEKYLKGVLNTKSLIIGYDLRIGSDHLGDFEGFKVLGEKYGFEVEEISRVNIESATVSSTLIRKALLTGNINKANELLGYDYGIFGKVIYGNQIGKKIGFPTANIEIKDPKVLLPCNGVYVVKVLWNDNVYGGMANIGIRPTISHSQLTLEVHLFGFSKNIYLDFVTVYFQNRLRDERRFNSLDELKKQLEIDKENAQKHLEVLGVVGA